MTVPLAQTDKQMLAITGKKHLFFFLHVNCEEFRCDVTVDII